MAALLNASRLHPGTSPMAPDGSWMYRKAFPKGLEEIGQAEVKISR